MVNLQKLDWTKCKLNSLPCLMASGAIRQLPVRATWDESHRNAVISVNGYNMMAKTGHGSLGWQFLNCDVVSSTDDMIELTARAKDVNAFIAAETSRIEKEELAANLVAVPWQDVEWLRKESAEVAFIDANNKPILLSSNTRANGVEKCIWAQHGISTNKYVADKRTLPAGYDPEKPRWVEIYPDQIRRLELSGAICSYFPASKKYKLDIHTLKPGVPLHEEPKPVPRPCSEAFAFAHPKESEARLRMTGEWVSMHAYGFVDSTSKEFRTTANEEPKPVPRPCTKEFALKHPKESEYRYRHNNRCSWFAWDSISSFNEHGFGLEYEFRTTAPAEKKARVVAEMTVEFNEPRVTILIASPNIITMGYRLAKEGKNPRIALIVDEES